MPRLSDLQLTDAPIVEEKMQSLDDLQETGNFLPMLQPGVYEFQIPANVDDVFSVVDEHQKEWKPESQGAQYLKATFDEAHPLKIVAGPDQGRVGEPFRAGITNVPRDWKMGGVPTKVKDFLYLLKKLGEKVIPATNRAYADALMKYQGKTFKSHVSVSWNCNPKRNARFWVVDPTHPQGAAVESTQPGCGEKYYPDAKVNPVTKGLDGKFPEQVQCKKCQAILRGFSNLDLLKEA